jgi:hypothetical protein
MKSQGARGSPLRTSSTESTFALPCAQPKLANRPHRIVRGVKEAWRGESQLSSSSPSCRSRLGSLMSTASLRGST